MVVAGVAGLPEASVDNPQRRREPRQNGLDLLRGSAIDQAVGDALAESVQKLDEKQKKPRGAKKKQ